MTYDWAAGEVRARSVCHRWRLHSSCQTRKMSAFDSQVIQENTYHFLKAFDPGFEIRVVPFLASVSELPLRIKS